jgi:DNA-binding response OmpR family regulator
MNRVLIVEDEEHLAAGLRLNLEAEGFVVEVEENGQVALDRLTSDADGFDVVLLDVMLPGLDGFEVVRRLREAGRFVPVMLLTARSHADDVLAGFEAGADDYLPKPFDLSILLARVQGLLRRKTWLLSHAASGPEELEEFAFAGKRIDFREQMLYWDGTTQPLSLMEATLMRYFVRRAVPIQHLFAKIDPLPGERELLQLLGSARGVTEEPGLAPQQSLHACQQNRKVERFGQVVVRACLEPGQHVVGMGTGGQQHHGHEPPGLTEPTDHLEPVQPREHHVQQDHVESVRIRGQPVQRDLAVFLDLDDKPLRFQVQSQSRGEVFLVLDDQHPIHDDFNGSSSVKVLPFPAPLLSAYARPPWRRATARTMDNPTPVPRTRDCSAAGRR